MKIVVLGGTGLLGKELERLDSQLECYGHVLNITDTTILYKKLDEIKPDIINDINHRTQYQDFMNLVKPKNVLSNDAFTYFTLKDYNGTDYNDIFTQKTIGGNKKNTLKRRNAKTKRSHAKKCKCRICIFGGNRKSRRGKHTKRI